MIDLISSLNISDYLNEKSPIIFLYILGFSFVIIFISKIDRSITAVMRWKRPDHRRDIKRVYSSKEKQLASKLCNNRCEGTRVFGRCNYRGKNLQGDHWYPYSRGGATTVKNLVMLCPKCNQSKSNKIPSRFQTIALRLRRRLNYDYLEQVNTSVGEWLPYRYNQRKIRK